MAKLRQKWWEGVMPDGFLGSVRPCLRVYENAVKRGNLAEVVAATDELYIAIEKDRKKLETQMGKKSREYKSTSSELADLTKLAKKEYDSAIKRGVGSIEVFNKDIGKDISAAVKKKLDSTPINISDFKVKLDIPLFVMQTLEYNGLETEIFRKSGALTDAFISEIADLVFVVVRRNSGIAASETDRADLRREMDRLKNKFEADLARIPEEVIRKAADNKIAAKMYKRDKAVSVTTASLGVAASAAAMAAPGTQAVAIVGLVRSAAKLTEEIIALAMTVDAKSKSLLVQVQALNTSYAKGLKGGKEVLKTTLNAILGADAIPTIKACRARMKELDGALSMVADRVSKQEKIIFEILDKSGALEKSLLRVTASRKFFKTSKISIHLKMLAKRLDALLKNMSKTMGRITAAETLLPRLEKQFDQLTDNVKGVAAAVTVIPIAMNLCLSFGSAADGIVASTQTINVVSNVIGVVGDIESEVFDLIG